MERRKTVLIEKIAQKGDDLETLKTLRQKIAKTIDESQSGRDIASLSRQLQIVMDRISELEEERRVSEGETVLDIVRKRAQKKRETFFEPDIYDADDQDPDEESNE